MAAQRVVWWLLLVAGFALVGAGVAQRSVDVLEVAAGFVQVVAAAAMLVADWDVLADHPDEEPAMRIGAGAEHKRVDLDEARRRRGAAGWQKPVKPPSEGSRPGGLPPPRKER